jgi:bifunctional enzyme CysN/CysC
MSSGDLIYGTPLRRVFISPCRSERRMARGLFAPGEFFEVFVDTPRAEVERRDVKGSYEKARRGKLKNFTGIDSPYGPPDDPEIRIDTTAVGPEQAAERVVAHLESLGHTAQSNRGPSGTGADATFVSIDANSANTQVDARLCL